MRKLKLQELNRVTPQQFREQQKTPIIIVLDNIRSGLNVGSAFRTGDAFAVEKIVLCGITARPPHKEILKTAIGATDSVEWTHYESTNEAVSNLKEEGYAVVAIEQTDQSIPLQDFSIQNDQKYALIFGNEVSGVSDEAIEVVEQAIEVPQFGTKHSLNIAVCLGVVTWEFFKQLKF